MKVSELISKLKEFDENSNVGVGVDGHAGDAVLVSYEEEYDIVWIAGE